MRLPQLLLHACLLGMVLLLTTPRTAQATHGLAGQITYRYIPNPGNPSFSFTYEITLTTYTNPCAADVDRCRITLELWAAVGNNQFVRQNFPELIDIPRVNGRTNDVNCPGVPIGDTLRSVQPGICIKKNIYRVRITLRSAGQFEIRYFDPTRIANVRNILPPTQSVNINWYCSTTLFAIPVQGIDNSPEMLNDPIDNACVGKLWTHSPAGFDADGDSLAYRLVPSLQYSSEFGTGPQTITGYVFPDQISPGANNRFSINPVTGIVTWNTPREAGIYNFGIALDEYRNGVLIGTVLRDMAVIVEVCTNDPPQIAVVTDTCVKAGRTLSFGVRTRDPNPNDSVYFYITNGTSTTGGIRRTPLPEPFRLGATLTPPADTSRFPQLRGQMPPPPPNPTAPGVFATTSTFSWVITCAMIRDLPYLTYWYAHDNLNRFAPGRVVNGPTLAANAVTSIRVLAPPVTNLTAVLGASRSVQLTWTANFCTNATGYEIYRAGDSLNVAPDSCCTGEPGAGYVRVGRVLGRNTVNFTDGPNLPFRAKYCYRVVAFFVPTPGDTARSCVSEQACVNLQLDFPLLLNVDVTSTNATTGSTFLRWRSPNYALINTTFFPPPYRFRLRFANGVAGTAFTNLLTTPDTTVKTFAHTNINTTVQGYNYQVELLDNNSAVVSTSPNASSIYLQAGGANQAVNLSWNTVVPWTNDTFVVARALVPAGPFVPVDTVFGSSGQTAYSVTDRGLIVGQQYCYQLTASGSYNRPDIHSGRLINRSNVACAVPVDTIPPCLPTTFASNVQCDSSRVTFTWTAPPDSCAADLQTFELYYKRYPEDSYPSTPIAIAVQLPSPNPRITQLIYTDPNRILAGCYAFAVVDSGGNRSALSADYCIADNCPYFQLPNVFTPNGDGSNDYFMPLNYQPFSIRGVRSIRCFIYDRYGTQVATSTDPNRLWDGLVNGSPAPAGVYYYFVEVVVESLRREDKITRTGSVSLLR